MTDAMATSASSEPLDVLIVGGGPVGASAAALLQAATKDARQPLRVAVLEHNRPAATLPDAPLDSRVSALSRASERILTAIGAWPLIPRSRMQPYERMRVWHESVQPRSTDVLEFDAAYAGEPNLGYIVENRLIQTAALTAFESAGGRVIAGELSRLRVRDHQVDLETSAGTLSCRLVVGADGARSSVRESIGLSADTSRLPPDRDRGQCPHGAPPRAHRVAALPGYRHTSLPTSRRRRQLHRLVRRRLRG